MGNHQIRTIPLSIFFKNKKDFNAFQIFIRKFFVGPPVFFYRSLFLYRRHKNAFRGWEWSRTTGTGLFRSLLYRGHLTVPELPQPFYLKNYYRDFKPFGVVNLLLSLQVHFYFPPDFFSKIRRLFQTVKSFFFVWIPSIFHHL